MCDEILTKGWHRREQQRKPIAKKLDVLRRGHTNGINFDSIYELDLSSADELIARLEKLWK